MMDSVSIILGYIIRSSTIFAISISSCLSGNKVLK